MQRKSPYDTAARTTLFFQLKGLVAPYKDGRTNGMAISGPHALVIALARRQRLLQPQLDLLLLLSAKDNNRKEEREGKRQPHPGL